MDKKYINIIYNDILYINEIFYNGYNLLIDYKDGIPKNYPCYNKEETVPYYKLIHNLIKKV